MAAGGLGLAGVGGAVLWRSLGDDGPGGAAAGPAPRTPAPSQTPSPVTGADDASPELQGLLDAGDARVVLPEGSHVLRSGLVVPPHVREIEVPEGTVLTMAGDEVLLRRNGRIEQQPRQVVTAVQGADAVRLADVSGIRAGAWVYLCSDDWLKEGKSKRGMLRRVEAVEGDLLRVDKPLISSLSTAPRAHVVALAPSLALTGAGALENADPQGTFSNLVRLDFVESPEVAGVELRFCGSAALRTFGTVGGTIDAYIHDCVDDQGRNHYGYGVSCTSTTRDLRVLGRIERVRHAFTTDHGYDALVESIAQTGEPEDIYVAPRVRETSSTGIDTHEPGDGITIVPDIEGCGTMKWGGMNVRARNVTIQGGTVRDSNEWGIFVQPSAGGTTVIRDVEVSGVRDGRGVHCKAGARIEGGSVSGFGDRFGIHIEPGTTVDVEGTRIDGGQADGSRGIALAGTSCSLTGTVANCSVGVLELPDASDNRVLLDYDNVAREVISAT
ncbi:right-handed parallel beta-helix repeat-containing protein [Vallicoccus soli]|uniref:right-handed parallel beta-helix repeat-containing protein n=1 Tax=Vallicoccus soli TaxID=2339232 RepID=UPI00105A9154|nr:right-handed parallel beta-helix repeat-containing protein [Vallicoccus soli]